MSSLRNEYWDIDAILAEDERITTKFAVHAVRLGFLDTSSQTEDLQNGAKVDLPLWLSKKLRENGMVMVRVPPFLLAQSRTHMRANATGVDLRAASPYYYEVAQRVSELADKQDEITESSLSILSQRYFAILDNAQSAREEDVSEYVQKLTVLETELYHIAADRAREIAKWKRREIDRVESGSKRSRRW